MKHCYPLAATLFLALAANVASAAIIASSGAATPIAPPADVTLNALESDTLAPVFVERTDFTLPVDLQVHITLPGTSPTAVDMNFSPGAIPAGTRIDSYYVHFDSLGDSTTTEAVVVDGSITFDRDVLGLIVGPILLNESNLLVGAPGTLYPSDPSLEIVAGGAGLEANDLLTLSSDRRTVTFNFRNTAHLDSFRIITEVPEPGSCVLLASGLGLLAAMRWRRRR